MLNHLLKSNVGSIDRIARVIIGLLIVSLAFVGPQSPWAYLGIILIVTGFISFCPLYRILRLNSCKR